MSELRTSYDKAQNLYNKLTKGMYNARKITIAKEIRSELGLSIKQAYTLSILIKKLIDTKIKGISND